MSYTCGAGQGDFKGYLTIMRTEPVTSQLNKSDILIKHQFESNLTHSLSGEAGELNIGANTINKTVSWLSYRSVNSYES